MYNMEGFLPIFLLILAILNGNNGAHREHKVHNIVLYPDKHSWCQTQQIKQVISYPGCKSEELDNNVCVGACFSYSIPHTEPSDPGEVIVPYCDSCQPSDTTWHHITLECEKNSDKTPPQLVKRVQIINNCSCSSCENDHSRYKGNLPNDDDSDEYLMMQQNDVPDLLRLLNNRNESSGSLSVSDSMKSLMNHKIVTLLKDIQEKNSRNDKDQLIELLKTIQGPEEHHRKMHDEKIADFVEGLNSENVELDLVRLREVLSTFEHSKYMGKHRKFLFTSGNSIDKDEQQHRQHRLHHHHHHHQQQHHSMVGSGSLVSDEHHKDLSGDNDGPTKVEIIDTKNVDHIVGTAQDDEMEDANERFINDDDDDDIDGIRPGEDSSFSPSKRHHTDDIVIDSIINHAGAAAAAVPAVASSSSGDTPAQHHHLSSRHHNHQQQQQQQHHHHVGEEIVGHGHLIQGPNGALVIERDSRIHEKLDVNPHELKPNHAGTFLSYSSGQSTIDKTKKTTVVADSDDD